MCFIETMIALLKPRAYIWLELYRFRFIEILIEINNRN